MDKKNKRFQCAHCDKSYATIEGILKHSVSAHRMKYDRRNGRTIPLTEIELTEEMKRVRRAQYRGKSLDTFDPSGEPGKIIRPKKARNLPPVYEDVSSDSTVSVESIAFHEAGQPSTSRSVELVQFPDNLSVQSDEVDVTFLDRTLHSEVVSVPPSRTSTPVPVPVLLVVHSGAPQLSTPSSGSRSPKVELPSTPDQEEQSTYDPVRVQQWTASMLLRYPEESLLSLLRRLAELRPPGMSDDRFWSAASTVRDFVAGYRQAQSILRNPVVFGNVELLESVSADMSPETVAVADNNDDNNNDSKNDNERSSDSEGALIIDLPDVGDVDANDDDVDSDL